MQFTISTNVLKDMVSKAVKGASCDSQIPLTTLMGIELDNNEFRLITTDASNYLYIRNTEITGDPFKVSVPVTVFSKLIARMTSDSVAISVEENYLLIKGNGSYKIEFPIDDDGSVVVFPDPLSTIIFDPNDTKEISLSTIQTILKSLKPALAVTMEDPCYTGYYIGNSVLATDTCQIACMDCSENLFGVPVLISPETMNLFTVMTDDKITVDVLDNKIVFGSSNCTIYGTLMECIDDYAVDEITSLVETKFPAVCRLSKDILLQLLDRLMLFIGKYDNNCIDLSFIKNGLHISSKSLSGIEVIPYLNSVEHVDFSCGININMFISQVKACAGDVIELYYGLDNAIKIVDDNVRHVIAIVN